MGILLVVRFANMGLAAAVAGRLVRQPSQILLKTLYF